MPLRKEKTLKTKKALDRLTQQLSMRMFAGQVTAYTVLFLEGDEGGIAYVSWTEE